MSGQGSGFSNWQCGIFGFLTGSHGMIISVIFWAVMIVLIVKFISYFLPANRKKTGSKPIEMLNQHYAVAELSKSEFEEIKQNIPVQL